MCAKLQYFSQSFSSYCQRLACHVFSIDELRIWISSRLKQLTISQTFMRLFDEVHGSMS